MSQPNQTSRNITPSRPGSGCVPPSQPIKITSSPIDDLLLGAWNSLPDADPAPSPIRTSAAALSPTPLPVRPSAAPADQEQRLVIPPLSRHNAAKPEVQTAAANRQAQHIVAPASPVSAHRPVTEPVKPYTSPAIPSRPAVQFSRPRSSSSFTPSLNLDAIRKWGTVLAGVVLVSLASYWGVSNVLGNSAPALKTIPVKGTVTLNGKPAPGASVQLHPVAGSSAPIEVHPRGQVSESGQVEFTTFTPNDGVPAGEYIATISYMKVKVMNGETVAGPQLAPAIFTKPSTSPVRVNVSTETRELTSIDFKKSTR